MRHSFPLSPYSSLKGDSSSKSRGLDKGGITEGLQGHPLGVPGVVASCCAMTFVLALLILLIYDYCCPRQRSYNSCEIIKGLCDSRLRNFVSMSGQEQPLTTLEFVRAPVIG